MTRTQPLARHRGRHRHRRRIAFTLTRWARWIVFIDALLFAACVIAGAVR